MPATPDRPVAPDLGLDEARVLARELFGVEGEVEELPSHVDRNFRVTEGGGAKWVLKVASSAEDEGTLGFQNGAMERVGAKEGEVVPWVRRSVDGAAISKHGVGGREHLVRMVSYLPGTLLGDAQHVTGSTWRGLGRLLGRLDRALEGIEHSAAPADLRWDLGNAEWTVGRSGLFEGEARRTVERLQLQFLGNVLRRMPLLPRGVIHNDANDDNVLVRVRVRTTCPV